MGWTTFASLGRDTIDLLKQEVVSENEHVRLEWIDHAQRGNVVYAVIKRTNKRQHNDTTYVPDEDGSYRFIAVFLTSRKRGAGHDFGYKDIAETMGPVENDCPKRLISLASPFRDDYHGHGRAWREACLAKARVDRQAKAAKPKPGQTFRTMRPVTFRDGTSHNEFTCVIVRGRGRKRTAYAAKGSGLFYSFRPETFGFEIIDKPANREAKR